MLNGRLQLYYSKQRYNVKQQRKNKIQARYKVLLMLQKDNLLISFDSFINLITHLFCILLLEHDKLLYSKHAGNLF